MPLFGGIMSLGNHQLFSTALKDMRQGNISRAVETCNQIIKNNPGDADASNLLGIMAKNNGNFLDAAQYFEQGLKQHPNHIYLLNSMGALAKQQGDLETAEKYLLKAINSKPDFVNALYNLSGVKTIQQHYSEAELLLKRVLKIQPENSEALGNLSALEEKQNNLTLATQYAEKALSLNPVNFIARLTLSNVHFRNENYQAVIEELIPTLSSNQNLTPINYSLAVGGIAQAYDKMKLYPEAYEHYKKSNDAMMFIYKQQFVNAVSIYAPENIIKTEQQIAAFDFSKWTNSTDNKQKSPVFLLGFPRSGTTLLDQMLAAHSQVTTLEEKETLIDIYQDYPVSEENLELLANLSEDKIKNYRSQYWERVSQYTELDEQKILVDKLPLNSIMLIYIYRLFPDAKIIFSVRDPRDVVVSCFQQRFSMNQAMFQFLDFETTVKYYNAVMGLVKTCRFKLPLSIKQQKYEQLVVDYKTELNPVTNPV